MFFYDEARSLIAAGVKHGWIQFPAGRDIPKLSKTITDEQAEIRRRKDEKDGEETSEVTSHVCRRCAHVWYDNADTCPQCLSPYYKNVKVQSS